MNLDEFIDDIRKGGNIPRILQSPIDTSNRTGNTVSRVLNTPDDLERLIENYGTEGKGLVNYGKQLTTKVVDIGKRLQAAFGGVSKNASTNLQRANFADAVANASVFIADAKTSFEDLVLTGETDANKGITLSFGTTGFITGTSTFFAPPPMITFSKSKRLEITVVDGTVNGIPAGEIIELYGHKPWDITLKGILVDMENHNHPAEQIAKLIDIFNRDAPWKVDSELCRNHGVTNMVFTDITSNGVEGFEDTWQYTIKAKSFQSVPFYLKQKALA